MFCTECPQYRDKRWESGTRGSCLEESGQGPGIRQGGDSRWRKVLDKTVNGDWFGRRRGNGRARLRRRGFTPSKGGKGGSICPGTGTVVRVVGHSRLLCVVTVVVRRDGCRQTKRRTSEINQRDRNFHSGRLVLPFHHDALRCFRCHSFRGTA